MNSPFIGCPVAELPTPCLTLDAPALEANLSRMQRLATGAGKALRPHAKSHKCSELAKRQVAHGAVGICAAKVSEAVALVEAGVRNVLLTGPAITPWAHEQVLRCAKSDPGFLLVLDDAALARPLAERAAAEGLVLRHLLDLDVGQLRTGARPEAADGAAAGLAALPGLRLVGIQAYAGHLQHEAGLANRREANRRALEPACEAWVRLQAAYALEVFSVGGTGTAAFDVELPGVTEIQPGSYALMDADYGAVEFSGEPFATALRLHTTVLSARHAGFATVDAGLKSVYRDGPAPVVLSPGGAGWSYDWYGDEYGRISLPEGARLTPAERLELAVSHCDPTVNLFDWLYLTEAGVVHEAWRVDLRGCSQ